MLSQISSFFLQNISVGYSTKFRTKRSTPVHQMIMEAAILEKSEFALLAVESEDGDWEETTVRIRFNDTSSAPSISSVPADEYVSYADAYGSKHVRCSQHGPKGIAFCGSPNGMIKISGLEAISTV